MTLILELPESKEAALKAKAQAQGVSAEQYVQQMVDRDLEEPTTSPSTKAPSRHISEVIRDIVSDIPPEVFENLPIDGASEHDHYLYGTTKRNQ